MVLRETFPHAIRKALWVARDWPIDVVLVHYSQSVQSMYSKIQVPKEMPELTAVEMIISKGEDSNNIIPLQQDAAAASSCSSSKKRTSSSSFKKQ